VVPTDFLLSGVSAGGIFQRISLALMKWGKGSCVQATWTNKLLPSD
jgi:hypothetical protein